MSNRKKSKWLQPGFLIAAAILTVSAVTFNVAVSSWKLKFLKEAVPLKTELSLIPPQLGDWIQVSKDEPLDHELQDTLATDKYIFRDYVNTRLVSKTDLAMFDGKGSLERKQILNKLQFANPEAVLNLAVTYYTGKVDTVAHIPERCMVADGYQPTETPETAAWDMGPGRLGKLPGEDPRVNVRFLNFEDQTAGRRVKQRIAYCFFVDGKYASDPITVRQSLGNLTTTHGFYSKVELMSIIPDHDECAKVMAEFLSGAMPEIEKCYPDWNSVEHPGVK